MLNGIARNIAHKFSVSANYFAYMAYINNTPDVMIDLISGNIQPESFQVDRNLNLVKMCMTNLRDMLKSRKKSCRQGHMPFFVFDFIGC